MLAARIQAARGVGGKPYDDAVRAYRKEFPDERNMDLIMIDAYFAHKLYDRVLASIDGLDHTLGRRSVPGYVAGKGVPAERRPCHREAMCMEVARG